MKNSKSSTNPNTPEEIKWGGFLNEFLWTFAGVHKPLLRQCPNEYAKYAGMGGTILCTAIMAMISGGYAIYFVFEDFWISCAFGLFWGCLILNLDRFIVSTMYSDGKHTISWLELKSGLPRIIMAILLGIVISTPLEMKLFEERIDGKIKEIQQERENQWISTVSEDNHQLAEWKKEKESIEEERKEKNNKIIGERDKLSIEVQGLGSSGKPGEGVRAKAIKKRIEDAEKELAEFDSRNGNRLNELNSLIKEVEDKQLQNISNYASVINETGFCQRYEAFAKIDDNDKDLTIVIWFIRLLFIIIEVAPVIFRMMIASGSYDELLKTRAACIQNAARKEREEIEREYETDIIINTERNRIRLEAENNANKELFCGIASAQSEVLSKAIENWKVRELEKVDKDPGSYIKVE